MTVDNRRKRFLTNRLEGLNDEPRLGAPRAIVVQFVAKTLEEKPNDATHWSTHAMAESVGPSQSAIVRIRTAFGLKLHPSETFKLSADPYFAGRSATWSSR